MILTVTPNPALDRVIFVDEFRPQTTMRAGKVILSVGGKGLDTSVALRGLGVETVGLGFAAGTTGTQLAALLDGYGIQADLIWLEGETRISHVVVETDHHRHSHMITGTLPVPEDAYQLLLQRAQTHLQEADWLIAGGSLPPGVPVSFYEILINLAKNANVPTLIDTSGPPALGALRAYPQILKMNQDEYCQTFGCEARTTNQIVDHAAGVAGEMQGTDLVVTMGRDGVLGITTEGAFLVKPPPQKPLNAAGAGDAVSAALAWRLSQGEAWAEALRWGAATSAASVLTPGTADCRPEDIHRILAQTEIREI